MKLENPKKNEIRFKVQAGMICTFDPSNFLKQRDSEISHVIVLRKIRKRFFGRSIWLVKNADDPNGEAFTCDEALLAPDNVVAVRYPSNIPEFNDLDVATISYLIEIMSDISVISIANEVDRVRSARLGYPKDDKNFTLRLERLKAIYSKIKCCKELRDI